MDRHDTAFVIVTIAMVIFVTVCVVFIVIFVEAVLFSLLSRSVFLLWVVLLLVVVVLHLVISFQLFLCRAGPVIMGSLYTFPAAMTTN